jgi:hypothetical protein
VVVSSKMTDLASAALWALRRVVSSRRAILWIMTKLLVLLALLGFLAGTVQAWGAPTSKTVTARRGGMAMKIFDWKQREAFVDYEIPAGRWCYREK